MTAVKYSNNSVKTFSHLAQIFNPVRNELAAWETAYREAIKSDEETFSRLSNFISSNNSEKIRPALILLSAKASRVAGFTAQDLRVLIKFAVSTQLIHTATVIHDDIIKNADSRRKNPQTNVSWGEEYSLLFGNHLLSRAFSLLSEIEIPPISNRVAGTFQLICQAQAMQLRFKRSLVLNEGDYIKLIKYKTASLISDACWSGACAIEANDEIKYALGNFGLNFGYALHIVDDCLNIMDKAKEDKEEYLSQDHKKSKLTSPFVYLISFLPDEEKKRVSNFLSNEKRDTPRMKTLAFTYRALEAALKKAKHFSDMAKKDINTLPKNEAKESLITIADFILERLSD